MSDGTSDRDLRGSDGPGVLGCWPAAAEPASAPGVTWAPCSAGPTCRAPMASWAGLVVRVNGRTLVDRTKGPPAAAVLSDQNAAGRPHGMNAEPSAGRAGRPIFRRRLARPGRLG